MENDLAQLAHRYIREITPYQPGKPIEELERELGIGSAIKLASNEHPFGPSKNALIAAEEAIHKSHIYPDGSCYALKETLAAFLQVTPSQLTIGNGSENILEIITKAYLNEGFSAVLSQYAFLTIKLLVKTSGATLIEAPASEFKHDVRKMVAAINATTRILFVVNPNNPTGTYLAKEELTFLLENTPSHILVVLDEAYFEYMPAKEDPNSIDLLKRYPNLIITRTFSKAYGLAALRVGYSISSPEIADILNRARLPFNVNSIAATAAIAALSDRNYIKETILFNEASKHFLAEELTKMGINFIPSAGNFLTIKVSAANEVYQKLLYQGVIVRPLNAYNMPNYIRVTMSTLDHMQQFLTAFKKIEG